MQLECAMTYSPHKLYNKLDKDLVHWYAKGLSKVLFQNRTQQKAGLNIAGLQDQPHLVIFVHRISF